MTDIDKRLDSSFNKHIKSHIYTDAITGKSLGVTIEDIEKVKDDVKQLINEASVEALKKYLYTYVGDYDDRDVWRFKRLLNE